MTLTTEKTYAGWREEQAAVEEALAELLPTFKIPHLSVFVAARISPMVGLAEARVRKILLWIAKAGHAHATQDGGRVRVYGRDAILWRWHPTPQKTMLPVGPVEASLTESGAIDTSEW